MTTRQITVAHSPDSDDAFMFYALATNKIRTGDLKFNHVLSDIETLNKKALQGEYEVTAVSFHAYAYLAERYALLSSGASMGDRYGPLVIAEAPMKPQELKGKVVAVPGEMTTAFLILKIFEPDFTPLVVPFDKIFETVMRRKAEAGLIIHEGQLTFPSLGLHKVIDLGEWWHKETQLPLPLGGNVIRKDLGQELISRISRILRQSIEYALEHRDEALNYAMQFARDMEQELADKFVGMYVNDRTLNYGAAERKAVQLLLNLGHEKNIIRQPVQVEFAE
ncbi:MAG: ABC transporter substrate-binding protein [Acidobacteria bacterium]|nr:ABC transporter substrate-binding protein [Acidobacteriota bacterium]MCI0626391.1 ABC transporter substrate-binding protein [Acidobacteriota bacterium]MCI0722164.1 ABC transporter substrate-binding protein [Acidobacteriota bacterium]